MAGPWYYRSAAAGTADGLSWANARVSLATMTSVVAGDTIYVADDHAETTAGTLTIAFPGTPANPNKVYCADRTVAVPAVVDLKITGTVSTTGTNVITITGNAYVYGLTFSCGTGAGGPVLTLNGANAWMAFENCALVLPSTGASSINTAAAGRVDLINTTMSFASVLQGVRWSGTVRWRNTPSAILGAAVPTILIGNTGSYNGASILLEGVDLSAIGSGKTLVQEGLGSQVPVLFKDCKLGASVTVAGTIGAPGAEVFLVRCDSGATNYRQEKHTYSGSMVQEITIVRTGGATDGTTPIAHKIVTTANAKFLLPFEDVPYTIWSDVVGSSVTVTVYGIGAALPNNDEVWIDVVYPGSTTTPQASFATSGKANNLSTAAAVSSDGSTWGGSTTAFKMSVSFTPQMKGPITIYVKVGKASATYYVDPKPVLS